MNADPQVQCLTIVRCTEGHRPLHRQGHLGRGLCVIGARVGTPAATIRREAADVHDEERLLSTGDTDGMVFAS